jgi:hypothetical protein
LFIGICVVTSAFYILSLLAERWLRHVDRLPVDLRTREKIFGMYPPLYTAANNKLIYRLACYLLLYYWIRWIDLALNRKYN